MHKVFFRAIICAFAVLIVASAAMAFDLIPYDPTAAYFRFSFWRSPTKSASGSTVSDTLPTHAACFPTGFNAGSRETELTASVKSILEPPFDSPDYVPFSSIGLSSLVDVNDMDGLDLTISAGSERHSGAHFLADSFAEDFSTGGVDLHQLFDPLPAIQSDFRECLNGSDFLGDELTPDMDAIAANSPAWIRSFPDTFTKQGSFVSNTTKPWLMPATYSHPDDRRLPLPNIQWTGRGKLGLSPVAYENINVYFPVSLYPRPGFGREASSPPDGQQLFLRAYFEGNTSSQSAMVGGVLQPTSRVFTVGLKTGVVF